MSDVISSRTPEGHPNMCDVCGAKVQIEPSLFPRLDAPCLQCGTLLVFEEPLVNVFYLANTELSEVLDFVKLSKVYWPRGKIILDFRDAGDARLPKLKWLLKLRRLAKEKRLEVLLRAVSDEQQNIVMSKTIFRYRL